MLLRETAVGASTTVLGGTRTAHRLQLSGPILTMAFFSVALAGCAPDHGRSAAPNYGAHDSPVPAEVSSPAEVSRNVKVSRTARPPRNANTRIASKAGLLTPIPVPDQSLLTPQPEPDCDFKPVESDAASHVKLDYERQCYRQAEIIVRTRLQLLQASVGEMLKAAILGRTTDHRPAASSKD
jgi:hypothetical protein